MADALAALGVIARRGVGNIRHLDTNHLWTQEVSAKKSAKCEKVMGSANQADITTNEISQVEIDKHVEFIGARFPKGRAEGAVRIATGEVKVPAEGGSKDWKR